MNKDLYKKLLLNALNVLGEYLGNEGCNDLFDGELILKDISKNEFKEIEKEWLAKFAKDAKDYDNKLLFDIQIVDLLENKVKENP